MYCDPVSRVPYAHLDDKIYIILVSLNIKVTKLNLVVMTQAFRTKTTWPFDLVQVPSCTIICLVAADLCWPKVSISIKNPDIYLLVSDSSFLWHYSKGSHYLIQMSPHPLALFLFPRYCQYRYLAPHQSSKL